MKYLPPRMATHPQASPRLREEVRAFYDRAERIAVWDAARRDRLRARLAERAAKNQEAAVDAPGNDAQPQIEDPLRHRSEAAVEMLGQLEALARAHARAHRRAERLAASRARLADQLALLLEALPEEERQALTSRKLRCDRLAESGAVKPKGQTETARAALTLLAQAPDRDVRPAEITRSLRAAGHFVSDNYGAAMLHVWQKGGLVARVGHGRYRIDHAHPDLVPFQISEQAEGGAAQKQTRAAER
ncbi:MAG: hypothetical protein AAGF44_01945 [Pseudomonadota bacterium]